MVLVLALTVQVTLALAWLSMAAPPVHAQPLPVTLASHYRQTLPIHQYWVSEKYDGIRAVWTGSQLLTRQGQPIAAPAWFTRGWPPHALDGELWAGRGQFARVQSTTAQSAADDSAWQQLRYMVFDLPQHTGPFTQRMQAIHEVVSQLQQPWVQAVPQWQVASHAKLMRQLRQLSQQGAEGLMLRHADATYRAGRSDDLIKLKMFEDAEAVVVQHLPGKGKYQGLMGALLVEMPSGQRFKIGSGFSDSERAKPPPIGSTITYRYNGTHPSGLPRFARYWRIRDGVPP